MRTDDRSPLPRRSFFTRLGTGVAAFGAAFTTDAASAQSAAPAAPFVPARHSVDDWLDMIGGKHRLYLDTTTVDGLGHAIFWSNNFLNASRTGYQLADADSAIVIGVRHQSTPFAFHDSMWTKYSTALAEHAAFTDPTTQKPPTVNLFQAAAYPTLVNRGVLIGSVLQRGVNLAVCSLATRAIATAAARQTGAAVDDVFKELTTNLLSNAHIVPAGIIAMSRAQERGFTSGYVA